MQIKTAIRTGEAVWDSTAAPGYFSEDNYASDPEININDAYRSTDVDWDGRMTATCIDDTGLWKRNEVKIDFNNTKMQTRTTYQRKVIAMHELGHAYGLSHVNVYCRLMKQGDEKFTCGTMPDSTAVTLVENLYP